MTELNAQDTHKSLDSTMSGGVGTGVPQITTALDVPTGGGSPPTRTDLKVPNVGGGITKKKE